MINIYNIFVGMKKCGLLLVVFLWLSNISLFAQQPPAYTSSEILLRIQKLKVLGSVLYMAAHPDDENTRLLGWLSNDQLVETGYLSVTRGDGGQNLIGDEQGIELGLIRTQELLAARRIDGAAQFFTSAFDFGYSKSTEEALSFWGREQVLGDAVWVIRKFRPDVIITRFPPDNRAGHGHHSASAVLAKEAFKLAGDSNAYPGQFKFGVKPWKATRLFWNNYNFGNVNTTSEDQMKIDVGGFNPLLGKSYGEIAAESRSQHKSQGFGVPGSRGTQLEYFSLTDGSKAVKSLTEGIDQTWKRIGASQITLAINKIIKDYSVSSPAKSVPALVALYQQIGRLPDGFWPKVKQEELKEIIAAANGIWLEAFVNDAFAMQGDSVRIFLNLNNREGSGVKLNDIRINDFDTAVNQVAGKNINLNYEKVYPVSSDMPVSQPYFLQQKMNRGSYKVDNQALIGLPQNAPAFNASFNLSIDGQQFTYTRSVQYKHTDPVKGELYEPLVVIPSASHAGKYGTLRHIDYAHIPDVYYFNNDTVKIALNDLKTDGKKIGYIEGAGDKVPEALTLMGYDVTFLKEKDISVNYLKQFDAVITGVRAYNIHQYLTSKNAVLNEYIKNGGNLIVQYNTNSYAGPNNAVIGPLPFHISRERITDENAPVRFLLPEHPVLNYPNKITQRDFDNWIQERGIYFADQLDSAFVTPLAMKDPGEEEMKGSLVIADYGKGKFVYTSLVFFRELPAGVPGAYRILANIIALNKKSR